MQITFANETDEDTQRGVLAALVGWTVEVTVKDEQLIRGDISPGQPDDRLDLHHTGDDGTGHASILLDDIDTVEIL